jgi:hypothetical protein
MREASVILDQVAETAGSDLAERIARHLALALLRDSQRFHEARENQSAFMRETIELLVSATEKLAADLQYTDAYRQVAADRTTDETAGRKATRARAAKRLRET